MKKHLYSSHFADDILHMVDQKQALGFVYEESQRLLYHFDQFCIKHFPKEQTLTKELCMAWAVKKESEGNNAFRNRMMPVRELAKYCLRQGKEAYVIPADLTPKGAKLTPHIYTPEELRILFTTLDQLPVKSNFPVRHLVIPTFFRLLYCCGLRPNEARNLRIEQVNLQSKYFIILESKTHRERVIYPSEDVFQLLINYNEKVEKIMPNRTYFFPSSQDTPYTKKWSQKTFRIQWEKSGLLAHTNKKPRIYDLRHTFATHRLYLWIEEGKDVSAFLPYLSTYMGHAQFSDTAYYIHLVPGLFEKMSDFDFSKRENLIMGVSEDEF